MEKPSHNLCVVISGLAGAGKTTLALKLKDLLEAEGVHIEVHDFDVDNNSEFPELQSRRWDAIRSDLCVSLVTEQLRANHPATFLELVMNVFESPIIPSNACHMISMPDGDNDVWVSDLDSGEVYKVDLLMLHQQPVLRKVVADDFGYSWCASSEHLSDQVYEFVMEHVDEET